MSGLVIDGWGAVTPAGVGVPALTEWLREPARAAHPIGAEFGEELPYPAAPVVPEFDVRALLGRKGTSTYDRTTALAVVACGEALAASGLVPGTGLEPGARVAAEAERRTGVVLGTTLGSLRSVGDFNLAVLTKPKPYLVNPATFPNTVMNSAAAQVAIRYGLRGVNSTIAGGPLGFLEALRYADLVLRRGHADRLLVGAAEEFDAYRAWHAGAEVPVGEGAAVFLVRPAAPADQPRQSGQAGGQRPGASVPGVASGFGAGALEGCVRRLTDRHGAVTTVFTGHPDEYAAAAAGLGDTPDHVPVPALFGDCGAATGALALAAFLCRAAPGERALITARTPTGGAAAALVERP